MNNFKSNSITAHPAITRVLQNILDQALLHSFQEIQIEPDQHNLLVSYRQYGELNEPIAMPIHLHADISKQLKILCDLPSDEPIKKTITGVFKKKMPGQNTLFKTTFLPVKFGEKFVIEIFPNRNKLFNIHDIGLADEQLFTLQRLLEKKRGIILITGPENSGTTSTAYSILSHLNLPSLNIYTLEDQVEYNFKHLNQLAVNPRQGLGFPAGWQAIKKQDADVIYLSRLDQDIPLNDISAMGTNKLILADLTVDDAFSGLAEFFRPEQNKTLTAESLSLILNQRLANSICPNCKTTHQLSRQQLRALESKFDLDDTEKLSQLTFYRGNGCPQCNYAGTTQDKTPLFEIIEVDEALTNSLIKHGLSWQTKKLLEDRPSIYEDGLSKALEGKISIDELLRVF